MAGKINWRITIALLGLLVGATACAEGRRHLPETTGPGRGLERYAEERYAEALGLMEASRFELAEAQFTIAEQTAVSDELRQSAREGRRKAAAIIEARR